MIAPQELRLGNKVIRNGIVVTVDYQTFWNVEKYPDQYQPIELTEDWLLKMGFDLLHFGKFRKVYDLLKDSRFGYSDNFGLANIESAVTFGCKDFTHVKYVHQLQNLYFALTGEELTIKEQK